LLRRIGNWFFRPTRRAFPGAASNQGGDLSLEAVAAEHEATMAPATAGHCWGAENWSGSLPGAAPARLLNPAATSPAAHLSALLVMLSASAHPAAEDQSRLGTLTYSLANYDPYMIIIYFNFINQ
jgi:hypothetical protein